MKTNPKKLEIAIEEISVFGFKIKDGNLQIDNEKKEIIENFSPSTNMKEMLSAIGLCFSFKRVTPMFGECEYVISNVFKAKRLSDEEKENKSTAFNELIEALLESQPLSGFKEGLTTIVETDVSDKALGAVLYQHDRDTKRLINFCLRKLMDVETFYSTTEKELLGVYYALKVFRPYLIGIRFKLKTDHKPLVGIIKKGESNLSARWDQRLLKIRILTSRLIIFL